VKTQTKAIRMLRMNRNFKKRSGLPRFILGSVGNSAFDLFPGDARTGPATVFLFIKFLCLGKLNVKSRSDEMFNKMTLFHHCQAGL
jgi:hypothetical protein